MKTKHSKQEIIRFLKKAGISTRRDLGFVTLKSIDHEVRFTVPRSVIFKLLDTLAPFSSYMQVVEPLVIRNIQKYLGPGEALKRARMKARLSQGELAEKLGIDRSNLVAMERGRRKIGRNMAVKLTEILDLDDHRLLM